MLKEFDVNKIKSLLPKTVETAEEARDFLNGDHWRGGLGWVGPTPTLGTQEQVAIMAEISRQFASRNVIKEVVDRHVSAILGSEPQWQFVPTRSIPDGEEATPEESAQSRKAELLLSTWWDDRKVTAVIREAITTLLVEGKSSLRIFIPTGKMQDGGITATMTPEQAVEKIFVENSSARLILDEETMEYGSVFSKTIAGEPEKIEFCFVDDDTTVIRIIDAGQVIEYLLPLNRKLIVHEMSRLPLVTKQMLSAQKSLNMATTMLDRNAIQGGFLERVILNAQPPGEWVDDRTNISGKTFIPKPLRIGSGKTTFLESKIVESSEAGDNPIVLPVDIRWRDPISPATFIATINEHRAAIYSEASQLHVLIAGDATASAVSRVQARADHLACVGLTKPEVDSLIRWLLDVVLSHICYLSGLDRNKEFGLIRSSSDIRVSSGPLLPEEITAVLDMLEKDMVSIETAMQMLGINDVAAERVRIVQESAEPLPSRKIKIIEAFSKIGYALAPEQLVEIDKILGVPERDETAVEEDLAIKQDMKREQLRGMKAANDPNDNDVQKEAEKKSQEKPPAK